MNTIQNVVELTFVTFGMARRNAETTTVPVNTSLLNRHRLKNSLNSSIIPVTTASKPPICKNVQPELYFADYVSAKILKL